MILKKIKNFVCDRKKGDSLVLCFTALKPLKILTEIYNSSNESNHNCTKIICSKLHNREGNCAMRNCPSSSPVIN